MEEKKKYFMDCNLAGRKYHEADEVWDKMFTRNIKSFLLL